MNRTSFEKHIIFAGLLLSVMPISAVSDGAIIINKDESKVKRVLTSKTFWAVIAGLGLVAGGGLGFLIWHNLKIKNETNALYTELLQLIEDNSAQINEYNFKIFRGEAEVGIGRKKYRENDPNDRRYEIWLRAKDKENNPYALFLVFFTNLNNVPIKEEHAIAALIEQHYEKKFAPDTVWYDPIL